MATLRLQLARVCNSKRLHSLRNTRITGVTCLIASAWSCGDGFDAAQADPLPGLTPTTANAAPQANTAAPEAPLEMAEARKLQTLANTESLTDDAPGSTPREEPAGIGVNLGPHTAPISPETTSSDREHHLAVSAPRVVGTLIGRAAVYPQAGLQLYGTDLGFTFEHAGRLILLCGDSYAKNDGACFTADHVNDDLIGTLPLDYTGALPALQVPTKPDAPAQFRSPQLFRDGAEVVLDAFKVPVAGFSSGEDMYVVFQSQTPVKCGSFGAENPDSCPSQAGVICAADIPVCSPAPITVPITCERCMAGQCPVKEPVCIDTHSSQYDGSARGTAASALSVVDIATPRASDPMVFDSIAQWRTNTFSHLTVRTVTKFTGKRDGNDYTVGSNSLMIWGRPSMVAEEGREARVYFATQALPLEQGGEHTWSPRYFAGLENSGEPRWSADAAQAKPLALDGTPDGDPHEAIAMVNLASVSWLGAPVDRWVMMYGGDLADYLLGDPKGSRASNPAGAIVIRFAEHPWGPWTAPMQHFAPGSAATIGDSYGPGGIAYSPACKDRDGAHCAETEPYTLGLFNACVRTALGEAGRLYAPNIVDRYTRRNENGGLDVSWLLSTWNPYSIVMMQTSIGPPVTD